MAGDREVGRRKACGDASGRPRERAARETRGKKKKHEESRQLLPACATGCIVPLLVFLNETQDARCDGSKHNPWEIPWEALIGGTVEAKDR